MNTFAKNMEMETTKSFTENGSPTFTSTLNANLDMFASMSAMRKRDSNDILNMFRNAYHENPELAIKNLFYLRDIRGGQGERNTFRICANYLRDALSEESFKNFIQYIPTYGRWDDVIYLINMTDTSSKKNGIVFSMLRDSLREDIKNMQENKSISLLAKWYPLENNTHNANEKNFAIFIRKHLFRSAVECRKCIVSLRKYISVLEQTISANKWNDVVYSSVPSCANKKYAKAFKKHDNERYTTYIQDVLTGKEKINSRALYPYEIVCKAAKYITKDKTEWDALWNNLPDYTNGNSAICVVDVSGSMGSIYDLNSSNPIFSAISLGMYFSERNKNEFKNKFFTFSKNPNIVNIPEYMSLSEKIKFISNTEWGGNTNLDKLFELYIKLAKKSNIEDLPKSVIIISDMEFDSAISDYSYHAKKYDKNTTFERIKNRFKEENIPMPNLVFWNVEARNSNFPVRMDETGTILVSGHSPTTFKFIAEGKTPIQFMLDVLNSERYANIKI